jgi:hypothetical protein
MMRNTVIRAVAVLGLLILASGIAQAGVIVADAGTIKISTSATTYGLARGNSGGEFWIDVQSGYVGETEGTTGGFKSFCVERYENFTPGDLYHVDIADSSVMSTGEEHPLSTYTAYAYKYFRLGALDSIIDGSGVGEYDYDYGVNADAGALQDAIWHWQGQTGYGYASLSSQAKSYVDQVEAAADANTNWDTANGYIGNVRILNVWHSSVRTEHQDQLTIVPLPTSALLGFALMGALGMVGAVRRRRRGDS